MSDTDLNEVKVDESTGQAADETAAQVEEVAGVAQTAAAQGESLDEGLDWSAALAGQAALEEAAVKEAPAVADVAASAAAASLPDMELIADIPVQLSVELGRTRMTIKQILQLGQGSVIELDSQAGQPMDIYINGYLIAQGEVVVVDERYGIRLTEIITPADRLKRLNRSPGSSR